jgi:hypothetical protein
MSKPKDDGKDESPPLDIQTEIKMLSYTVTLKDIEIQDLKNRNKELRDTVNKMNIEVSEMKAAYVQSLKTEKTVRQMQEMLDHSEKEVEKLKEEKRLKERDFHEDRDKMRHKFETEILSYKSSLVSYEKKIENVNNLQKVVEKQEDHIRQLEIDKEKLKIEADERVKNKEIRNQIKFSELKKKMMENIQETQKNVTQLNIEYMDVSTKLTLLQNHQLLIELEYQSQQIEELIIKKENLEKKVFELTQDIEVHKEVELALASKNKKYAEMVKNLERSHSHNVNETDLNLMNSSSNINLMINDSSSLHKQVYVNSGLKEFNMVNGLEKKILKLELSLKKKGEDYSKLKSNFEFLEDKLKNYEKKYAGLFYLFEEGLKRFAEDEEIIKNRDIYVNLENIKKGDFSNLSNSEQYSIIVLIMKYLIPLVNPSDLKGSDSGMGSNFENVNVRYHMSKKFKEDPMLKKVFSTNKNTMMHSIRKSLESLPMISSNTLNSSKTKNNILLMSSDKHSKSLI